MGIVQEIKIPPYWQMIYVKTRICSRKWNEKLSGTSRCKQITRSQSEVDFSIPPESAGRWKIRQICGPCQRAEKVSEYKGDGDTSYNFSTWKSPQKPGKKNVLTED